MLAVSVGPSSPSSCPSLCLPISLHPSCSLSCSWRCGPLRADVSPRHRVRDGKPVCLDRPPGCGRQHSPTSSGLACTSGSGVRWGLGCVCGDGWRAGWSFEGPGGGAVGRSPRSGRGFRGTMPAAAGVPPAAGKPVLCDFHSEGPPLRREPAPVPPALCVPSTFRNLCWTGYSASCPNQTSATCSLCFCSRVAPNPAHLLQLRLTHSPTQRGLPFFSDYRSCLVSTRAVSKLASFLFSFG